MSPENAQTEVPAEGDLSPRFGGAVRIVEAVNAATTIACSPSRNRSPIAKIIAPARKPNPFCTCITTLCAPCR